MARFTKEDLQAVVGAASKGTARPYLNAIHIDGGKLVATNGHYMQSVDTGGAPGAKPFTLGAADATKLIKAMSKGQSVVMNLSDDGHSITCAIDAGGGSFEFEAMPGEYPGYSRIVPSGEVTGSSILVNAKYLKAICDAAIKSGRSEGSQTPNIRIDIRDPLTPVHIRTVGLEKGGFEAVLMPLRPPREKKD